ncbi:MAG TPA: leucyl aminopeptidase [Thermoanaerobaculia bacterium]|nr:leucyl aminopeptidase [Thermoanaerobaculia bacterium]
MDVNVSATPEVARLDHVFFFVAEDDNDYNRRLPSELARNFVLLREQAAFTGKSDESVTSFVDKARKVTLSGLGKRKDISARSLKVALYAMAKSARKSRDRSIALVFPYELPHLSQQQTLRLLIDLTSHSDYRYDSYKTGSDPKDKPHQISCTILESELGKREASELRAEASILSKSVRNVRDLGNGPANVVTPSHLAERAAEVAESSGVSCTVLDRKQIEKLQMGGLLAVSRGSDEEPRLIVLDYKPKRARKTICLVGKGITFDSGGISIKPSEKMEEMKFDMCGAAAVIGIIEAAARLGIRHRLIGIIPSTENLSGGSAYKPGDIIRMMSGKSVEVVNTDAEGRMILADALHYAESFKPDHMIDFATLTGGCVVALGSEATGLFSNDDELAQKLIDAGEKVGERLWRLPEWDAYKDLIRSEWADIKNSGGRWGAASSAAVFLKEFVNCPSWAHLDIAGTAAMESETSREPRGATGVGVRMAVAFLEAL